MEKDLRMLTLFKQHYLNEYKLPLKSDYSCWGYYDGLSISKVEQKKSKLYEKRTKAPISELWYSSMFQTEKLEGIHSRQNIGIFRCIDTEDKVNGKTFWERNSYMPFFSVGFLQLKQRKKYKEIAKKIEDRFQEPDGADNRTKYGAITYCTFDNADLVVLIHGNRIGKLEEIIREIEGMSDIKYCHSIMGVSESDLKEIDRLQQKNITWDVQKYHGEDPIARITMKIVTDGSSLARRGICAGLSSFPSQNVKYYKVTGHESLVVDINNGKVKDLLKLLQPKGFATHQNPLYGSGIYNIETSIYLKEAGIDEKLNKSMSEEAKDSFDEESETLKSWCIEKIKKYRGRLESVFDEGNESMYSYYVALMQTLNTLTQYEKFDLSRDIFNLLFPAFEMFDAQMDTALKTTGITEDLKESVCQFLESVNSIIYHTVHTDQIFLMIPGYSGTTFAIPIKLCLLYAGFVKDIIELINDSKDHYRYECLLVPVVESTPQTDIISMGLPQGDRLISMRLSQRSLYMPRNLMIILAHEVSHYVGSGIRHRKMRLENIIKSLSAVIAEEIIPCSLSDDDKIAREFKEVNRKKIWERLVDGLIMMMKKECTKKEYHARDVEGILVGGCEQLLVNDENGVCQGVIEISDAAGKALNEKGNNFINNVRKIQRYQESFEDNRKNIISAGVIEAIVKSLMKTYSEVFSDMAAMALLDFDEGLYREAFYISEGALFEGNSLGIEGDMRSEMISYVRNGTEPVGLYRKGSPEKEYRDDSMKIVNYLYGYDTTIYWLKEYALRCYEETKKEIETKKDKLDYIRKTFELFSGTHEYSCDEIYERVNQRIEDYIESVGASYKEIKRNL